MNPHHRDRQELLEDIFAPEGEAASSASEVVEIIARAKASRRRVRRLASCAAVLVVAAGVCTAIIHSKTARELPPVAKAAPTAGLASRVTPIVPPGVERVDDEAVLALIEDQPTALVRWPDGRQTLLVMNVANRSPQARALPPARRFGPESGR